MTLMKAHCNDKRFTRSISDHLQAQGISGRELARRLEVSHSYIARRLAGSVDLSTTDLLAISEATDLPLSSLFDGEER